MTPYGDAEVIFVFHSISYWFV